MFAPVVKSVHVALDAAAVAAGAHAAAIASAMTAPTRPVYLEIATDLLARRGARGRRASRPPVRGAGGRTSRAAAAALDARGAPADLGRRRRARRGGRGPARSPSGSARRCSPPTARRGLLPPDHPCLVGLPPHVEAAGRLWDEADVVLAIGSDLDGVQTQNFAQPQPPTLIAICRSRRPTNYRVDICVDGDAVARRRPRRRRSAHRRRRPDLARRARETCAGARRDRAALPRRDPLRASPTTASSWSTCASPATGSPASTRRAAPRRLQVPLGWGTLGYAFPAALGAALAGTGPVVSISGDGGFLFACGELATMAQEQIPLTAVIVDDGGYGMLRYDQVALRRRDLRRRPPHARLRGAGRGLRRPRRRPSTASTTRSARPSPATSPTPGPSVLVARTPAPLIPPPNTSPNWYRRRKYGGERKYVRSLVVAGAGWDRTVTGSVPLAHDRLPGGSRR